MLLKTSRAYQYPTTQSHPVRLIPYASTTHSRYPITHFASRTQLNIPQRTLRIQLTHSRISHNALCIAYAILLHSRYPIPHSTHSASRTHSLECVMGCENCRRLPRSTPLSPLPSPTSQICLTLPSSLARKLEWQKLIRMYLASPTQMLLASGYRSFVFRILKGKTLIHLGHHYIHHGCTPNNVPFYRVLGFKACC